MSTPAAEAGTITIPMSVVLKCIASGIARVAGDEEASLRLADYVVAVAETIENRAEPASQ